MQVTVSVNGEEYTRDVEPRLLLVHFLRDVLRLTGTDGRVLRGSRTYRTCALRG